MILIRKSHERGQTRTSWLRSYHTFSFANYYDERYLGFGNLLVINEDTVQPSNGFNSHPHSDMEIVTYVISGTLQHKDSSTGEPANITAGEIQRMSAGTGIRHSETNPSDKDPVHFLQIWILPNEKGLTPSYEQKKVAEGDNQLLLVGSAQGEEGTITIHQDVDIYFARLTAKNSIAYNFDATSYGWLQLIKGNVVLNEELLMKGDGAAIIDEDKILIEATEDAEFLLFDFTKH